MAETKSLWLSHEKVTEEWLDVGVPTVPLVTRDTERRAAAGEDASFIVPVTVAYRISYFEMVVMLSSNGVSSCARRCWRV